MSWNADSHPQSLSPGPGNLHSSELLGGFWEGGPGLPSEKPVTGPWRELDVFQSVIRDFPQLKIPLMLLQTVGFRSFIPHGLFFFFFLLMNHLGKKKKKDWILLCINSASLSGKLQTLPTFLHLMHIKWHPSLIKSGLEKERKSIPTLSWNKKTAWVLWKEPEPWGKASSWFCFFIAINPLASYWTSSGFSFLICKMGITITTSLGGCENPTLCRNHLAQNFTEKGLKKKTRASGPLFFFPFSEFILNGSALFVFHTLHQICKYFIASIYAVPLECVALFGSTEILPRMEKTLRVIWKPYRLTPWLNFIGLFHSGFCVFRAVLSIRRCGPSAQGLWEPWSTE